jgi:general secretion pathway protein A
MNRKSDIFKQIQECLTDLFKDRRITPIIIIDEAQYLKTGILNDLKILLNFEMDSQNYAILILTGQPQLNSILSKRIHEPLRQRITINYQFSGINSEDTRNYIIKQLNVANVSHEVFQPGALEALANCANGSIRILNTLVDKCLLIAFQKQTHSIDTEIVMLAENEINFI